MQALDSDSTPDTKQFGGALFDALFHGELLDRLRRSLSRTAAGGRGRLRFSDAHELWNTPWGLLYDESHRFLSQFWSNPEGSRLAARHDSDWPELASGRQYDITSSLAVPLKIGESTRRATASTSDAARRALINKRRLSRGG